MTRAAVWLGCVAALVVFAPQARAQSGGTAAGCKSDADCFDLAPRCDPDGVCREANACVPDADCEPDQLSVTGGACDCRAAPGSARSTASFVALALALGALRARRGGRRTTLRD
jgi:hypothetical protein